MPDRLRLRLRVEWLEARRAPVVGAFTQAPLADPTVFGGVVEVFTDTGIGSGTLLYSGRHVLTAAHVVDENGDHVADSTVWVRFVLPGRTVDMPVAPDQVAIWPGWTGLGPDGTPQTGKDDLALLYLPALAPSGAGGAGRFDLYRQSDELGRTFLMLGFGRTGTGATGGVEGTAGDLRFAYNQFETTGLIAPGDFLVPPGYGLAADFDDGTARHDAFGQALGLPGTGLGPAEGAISFGDSGGPAFITVNGTYLLAGVGASLVSGGPADADSDFGRPADSNSSFGDLIAFTRVSVYADGIDSLARDVYDLTVDLNYQPVGNDGTPDAVRVEQSGGAVEVFVDGRLVQSDPRTRVQSVTVIASSDGGSFAVGSAVSADLYVQSAGFASASDARPVVTAVAPPGVRPVAPLTPAAPDRLVAVGADAGFEPRVRVYDPTGAVRFDFLAFDPQQFFGGVRVALGDVNGDGFADVIAGSGPGDPPLVRVFDGRTAGLIASFEPFESTFTGGVYVAAGDFTGDGKDDLVVTPDQGGGPRVRVLRGTDLAVVADFFAIDDPNFRGGARAAVGDVTGDGAPDLLVGAGFGGGPRVAGFDGRSLATGPVKLFPDFFVFEDTLRNGVFLAAGDLNLDQSADLIAGGGPGGGPRVFALSGKDLVAGRRTQLANFFAGDPAGRGGVRVAGKDLDADGFADIVAGSGEGSGSHVTAYIGAQTRPDGIPPTKLSFDAFPGFDGGVFVG